MVQEEPKQKTSRSKAIEEQKEKYLRNSVLKAPPTVQGQPSRQNLWRPPKTWPTPVAQPQQVIAENQVSLVPTTKDHSIEEFLAKIATLEQQHEEDASTRRRLLQSEADLLQKVKSLEQRRQNETLVPSRSHEIDALKASHALEMANLRRQFEEAEMGTINRLEGARRNEVETLKLTHANELQRIQIRSNHTEVKFGNLERAKAHEVGILTQMNKSLSSELDKIRQQGLQAIQNDVQQVKQGHANELDELKVQLVGQHNAGRFPKLSAAISD